MDDRPFLNQSEKPTEAALKITLGGSYLMYRDLVNLTKLFKQEWNFSKMSGWMLKVFDQKKALFYLIPYTGSFKISLAIRENERVAFLDDKTLQELHQLLESVKKYSEGYALQFMITDMNSYLHCSKLIMGIIEKRSQEPFKQPFQSSCFR